MQRIKDLDLSKQLALECQSQKHLIQKRSLASDELLKEEIGRSPSLTSQPDETSAMKLDAATLSRPQESCKNGEGKGKNIESRKCGFWTS